MDVVTPNRLGTFLTELQNQNIFALYNHEHDANPLVYSTDAEQPVGVWIDGRTIYRRTFHWSVNPLPSNKWAYYQEQDLADCNIDQYVNCSGLALCVGSNSSTAAWQPIPRVCPDALAAYSIGFGDLSSTSLGVLFGTSYVSAEIYFTVDFVKAEETT